MGLASEVVPFALAEEVLVGQGSVAVQVNQVPQAAEDLAFAADLASFQAAQLVDFVVAVFDLVVEASLVLTSCLVAEAVQVVSASVQAEAVQEDRAAVVQGDQAVVVQVGLV